MLFTGKYKVRIAELEAQLAAEEGRRERAELELERVRQDFNTVVAMLGNRANALQSQPLFDRDPFAEDSTQLDTFLTPAPGDFVDPESVLEELSEAEEGKS